AARPHIGVPVTDALARSDNESVLLALVRNATAKISDSSYRTLVEKSRALTGLQEPLVRRPDMPPQLATIMCDWVSDALKSFRAVFYKDGARTVALVCRAAGIDRAVFATVFNLSRQARGLPAALAPGDFAAADSVFSGLIRQSALEELRAMVAAH